MFGGGVQHLVGGGQENDIGRISISKWSGSQLEGDGEEEVKGGDGVGMTVMM